MLFSNERRSILREDTEKERQWTNFIAQDFPLSCQPLPSHAILSVPKSGLAMRKEMFLQKRLLLHLGMISADEPGKILIETKTELPGCSHNG